MSDTAAPAESVARLLGRRVESCAELAGGRNSRVFRMEAGGRAVAAKLYFRHPLDPRDRLQTEFGSLSWLWNQGVRDIPEPLAKDDAQDLGVYEFLDGTAIPRGAAGAKEIEGAIAFLDTLRGLAGAPGAREFAPASEAFFSASAIAEGIRRRAARLDGAEDPVNAFVTGELLPFLKEREAACAAVADDELPPAERLLSPSDFGFHNASRAADGALRFYDFEYFGWDDPAKTLSDFLLHPAMALGLDARRAFARAFLARFGSEALRRRFPLLYPLFGVKWCLIMLNEFAPGHRERRAFARGGAPAPADRERQFADARALLARLKTETEAFPYHG